MLLNENARELLLQLSRDFIEQKNGRMCGKEPESAKNMGAPAWKVFVLDSLKSNEELEGIHAEIADLIEEMAQPSLVDAFVILSKILIEQKVESSSMTANSKRKESIGADIETTGPNQKKVAKPRGITKTTTPTSNGSRKPPPLGRFTTSKTPPSLRTFRNGSQEHYDHHEKHH